MTPKPHNPARLSEVLRKVAIAGVTVNAGTREPNEIYHLLNSELKPLCGAGDTEGPAVMAVKAPWILRCERSGCMEHWRHITEPNEVIITAGGDCYHYDVHCRAFRIGRLGSSHAGYRLHEVKQMTVFEAEHAGKKSCPSCGHA